MFDKPIMTSLELVAKINKFREEEAHGAELLHKSFMASIRREFAGQNILLGSYLDENNQERPLIKLTRRQSMIMGMKESGTVRHRVMDYIESLEAKVGMTDEEILKASFDILTKRLEAKTDEANEKSVDQHTPTQLGRIVGKKADEINIALVAAGFQTYTRVKYGISYYLTEKGKEFGVYATSKEARVQQIRWRKSVLEFIKKTV